MSRGRTTGMDDFAQEAHRLLGAFRRRRPLRAGSLITTVFGDSLAARKCEVSLSGLIALMAPFGLTERLVRTSIGRLAKDGWVAAQRVGRLSYYRLSVSGEDRFAAATQRIYAAPLNRWDGIWTTLIVPSQLGRDARDRIRDTLRWSGFGQIAPGVYLYPGIDCQDARRLIAADAGTSVMVLQARSETAEGDRQMIGQGWDLADLERRYSRFIARFAPAWQAITQGPMPDPQHCFHVRTLLIHEYRKVHLLDPQLPRLLLPQDWAGNAAYEMCRQMYRRIASRSDAYVQSMLSTRSGPLPAPDVRVELRFAPAAETAGHDPHQPTG